MKRLADIPAIRRGHFHEAGISPEYAAYTEADSFKKGIEAKYSELAYEVVAKSEVNLVKNKPIADTGKFKPTEANLGDRCADAFRTILGAPEHGAANISEGSEKLLHISGLTYEIHTQIPSSEVLSEKRG